MERLLADLRSEIQQLTESIAEATSAVDDHHLAWQQLAARYQDSLPDGPSEELQERINRGRRREAYYLGQAVALTWALQLLNTTLRRHSSLAAGRVFSCPLPSAQDASTSEYPVRPDSKQAEQQSYDSSPKSPVDQEEVV